MYFCCCFENMLKIHLFISSKGTHVIYAFANIESGVLSGIWSNPLKDLRKQNKDVKLMVAVGGWG